MTLSAGKPPELLAPAGDLLTALTAFDAGADAVYCGLKKFNARERSGNFSEEELGKLIRYAHSNGKKVYVTFNTVIKEGEVPEAIEALSFLDYIRPDALILQDLGMIHIAREYFPRLTLHGSTQMALHNSDDLAAAKALGLSRVILERQTTLEELELMAERSPLELELFVHGALCCCLSGTCLFSSYVTGGSGNRGRCRQLCRQKFYIPGEKEGKFYFSTGDLMGAEFIPLFRKWGIASLKIEGRLRKPDYAARVTKGYRMLLDAEEKDFAEVWKEAAGLFERIPSREYTGGFYTPSSAGKVIKPLSPPGLGLLTGKVTKVTSDHIEAELSSRLHLGDDVRIQKEDGTPGESFRLLSLACNGKKVLKAFRGQKVTFPRPPEKNIPPRGLLFRTGESYDRMEKRIGMLPPHLPEEDLFLTLTRRELTVTAGSFPDEPFRIPLALAPAREHPVTGEFLEKELDLSASNDIPILSGRITGEVKENCFLPKSLCRELRREIKKFLASLPCGKLRELSAARGKKALETWENAHSGMAGTLPEKVDLSGEYLLPLFLPETELEKEHLKWEKAVKEGKGEFFRTTSIGSLYFLHKKTPSSVLTAAAPIPVANSFAVKELSFLGAARAFLHLELGKEDMLLLAQKSSLPLLLWEKVRPVLLATRASLGVTGTLEAASGEKFLVEKEGPLFLLKPAAMVVFPPLAGVVPAVDQRRKEEDEEVFSGTSSFNFDRGLG